MLQGENKIELREEEKNHKNILPFVLDTTYIMYQMLHEQTLHWFNSNVVSKIFRRKTETAGGRKEEGYRKKTFRARTETVTRNNISKI